MAIPGKTGSKQGAGPTGRGDGLDRDEESLAKRKKKKEDEDEEDEEEKDDDDDEEEEEEDEEEEDDEDEEIKEEEEEEEEEELDEDEDLDDDEEDEEDDDDDDDDEEEEEEEEDNDKEEARFSAKKKAADAQGVGEGKTPPDGLNSIAGAPEEIEPLSAVKADSAKKSARLARSASASGKNAAVVSAKRSGSASREAKEGELESSSASSSRVLGRASSTRRGAGRAAPPVPGGTDKLKLIMIGACVLMFLACLGLGGYLMYRKLGPQEPPKKREIVLNEFSAKQKDIKDAHPNAWKLIKDGQVAFEAENMVAALADYNKARGIVENARSLIEDWMQKFENDPEYRGYFPVWEQISVELNQLTQVLNTEIDRVDMRQRMIQHQNTAAQKPLTPQPQKTESPDTTSGREGLESDQPTPEFSTPPKPPEKNSPAPE